MHFRLPALQTAAIFLAVIATAAALVMVPQKKMTRPQKPQKIGI